MAILFTGENTLLRQVPTHTFKDENGEIHEIKGWLGSGIYTKDNKEIFEGDIIKSEAWLRRLHVFWEDGALMVDDYDDPEGGDLDHSFNTCTLWIYLDSGCEIVGHVSTESPADYDEDDDND